MRGYPSGVADVLPIRPVASGPRRPLRVDRLRRRCRLPASILSLSLALRSRGSSADSVGSEGACSARRSASCPGRGAGPAPLRAGGSAIGCMPRSMPSRCTPVLGCFAAVGSRASAGRACAAPAGAPRAPIPASRHRGPDGLQGSPSNVATSSQERRLRRRSGLSTAIALLAPASGMN